MRDARPKRQQPGDFVRAGEHPGRYCDNPLTDLEPMECHSRYPGSRHIPKSSNSRTTQVILIGEAVLKNRSPAAGLSNAATPATRPQTAPCYFPPMPKLDIIIPRPGLIRSRR